MPFNLDVRAGKRTSLHVKCPLLFLDFKSKLHWVNKL